MAVGVFEGQHVLPLDSGRSRCHLRGTAWLDRDKNFSGCAVREKQILRRV